MFMVLFVCFWSLKALVIFYGLKINIRYNYSIFYLQIIYPSLKSGLKHHVVIKVMNYPFNGGEFQTSK